MATMKQVADKAGVSTTTVSHVINESRVVSKDVRERVLAAIQDLRYIPSAVARSLKNDKTYTLGVLVPNSSNPYFAELIQGVEDAAFNLGYSIILCNAYDDPKKQVAYVRVLMEKRIDGLILVSSGSDPELTRWLSNKNIPKVLVDRELSGVAAASVESDHEHAGYLATKYLVELGHHDIACVSGPEDLLSSSARVAGYRRALKEASITPHPDHLLYTDFTSKGGFEAFRELLSLRSRPTAVFAGNDLVAMGGICAANEQGVRVPEDLSVIGYDDIALASYCNPPLTTISQPKREIGELTARILVERITNAIAPLRRELLPPVLVVRKSTVAPR